VVVMCTYAAGWLCNSPPSKSEGGHVGASHLVADLRAGPGPRAAALWS